MNYYRHGDLGFTPIKEIPKGVGGRLKKVKSAILAEGEATGHYHKLTAKPNTKFSIRTADNGDKYLKLGDEAELTHQEHNTITLNPGLYLMQHEREFNYFEKKERQVYD